MKQTAVEWLIKEIGEYFPNYVGGIELVVNQAKEMERQQIIDAHHCGRNFENKYPDSAKTYNETAEQYYNETYKQ